MTRGAFCHVRTWVFDLDNTLYPPEVNLFAQIEQRMTDYVMGALAVPRETANRLRTEYWHTYGTTLSGLMREHDVDPVPYLQDVHDISFEKLTPDPDLIAHISALPGRKIVYTNGTAPYAENVLAARGLSPLFDAVYGIEHAGYLPKPERAAFDAIFAADGLQAEQAAMFEDDHRNLQAPHDMGLRTVHVAPQEITAQHIHHYTDDLTGFLRQLV